MINIECNPNSPPDKKKGDKNTYLLTDVVLL